MPTTSFVIDRICWEYPDPHDGAHRGDTTTDTARMRMPPGSHPVQPGGHDHAVSLAVRIAPDQTGRCCLHVKMVTTAPGVDDTQRWAPDPLADRNAQPHGDAITALTTKPGADTPSTPADLQPRGTTCAFDNWPPDQEPTLAPYPLDPPPAAGWHPRHRREPHNTIATTRPSRHQPNGDRPRPGRRRQTWWAASAQPASGWESTPTITASSPTRPTNRFFGRRVNAVLVVAVTVTAFMLGRSQHQPATAMHPTRAVSPLPRIQPGLTGPVDSGLRNSDGQPTTNTTTRTITTDDRRALTIGARALGLDVDTLAAMVVTDATPTTPTIRRSIVERLDKRRAQAADALAHIDLGAGGAYQAAADAAAELKLLTFEQAIAAIDLPNLTIGGT